MTLKIRFRPALALILAGIAILTLFRAATATAAECTTVCYVDDATGNDANGGTSPADAKKTVQAAVNQVLVNGTVIVAPGTYTVAGVGHGKQDDHLAGSPSRCLRRNTLRARIQFCKIAADCLLRPTT